MTGDELAAVYLDALGAARTADVEEIAVLMFLRLHQEQVFDLASDYLAHADTLSSVGEMAYVQLVHYARELDAEF